MLFYSFFKTLVGKDIVVELKCGMNVRGILCSVDQYLNLKLRDISVAEIEDYPHMRLLTNVFIRGSVVRYVLISPDEVDTQLLQDASRNEIAKFTHRS